MPKKKKDNHVIQPDNLIIRPLTTVQMKERMKVKLSKLNKGKE